MDKELHKKFSSVIRQMNNTLTEIQKEEKRNLDPGQVSVSPAIYKTKYAELKKEFETLRKDVLEEISYLFTGDNMPETIESCRKYLNVIKQSSDVVCNNFRTTSLKPEYLDRLGAYYVALIRRESEEEKKQKSDINYEPQKRTVDDMALVFAVDLDDLYKRINNKLDEFKKSAKEDEPETPLPNNKLKWLCTPAQFAFIIDLLIIKGYIKRPSNYAERSASLFLTLFEFNDHNPSKQSLGKLLHKDVDPINNPEHKSRFLKIPNRDELEK